MDPISLEQSRALDGVGPFASMRAEFELPTGVIYLDGNSLRPLQTIARKRIEETVATQWGDSLIRSWSTHDWTGMPASVGSKIAKLIGAESGTVVAADSISINLFKILAVALRKRLDRCVILSEKGNFPTELYISQGLIGMLDGDYVLRTAEADDLANEIDSEVAVVLLTEVDYRSARRHDMAEITRAAHASGTLIILDLAHSAGAFPVNVHACDADFAVGCGYKYLNGGPGAPAFLYVAPRHLEGLTQPIAGWHGHATSFSFSEEYEPAASVDCMLTGTSPIVSLAGFDAALDMFLRIDMYALREKVYRLFDVFVCNVEAGCPDLSLLTPRDQAKRETQAAFTFREGYAAMQALIARGVIGDFRTPSIMRFGFAASYLSHFDFWNTANAVCDVISSKSWDNPVFRTMAKVV